MQLPFLCVVFPVCWSRLDPSDFLFLLVLVLLFKWQSRFVGWQINSASMPYLITSPSFFSLLNCFSKDLWDCWYPNGPSPNCRFGVGVITQFATQSQYANLRPSPGLNGNMWPDAGESLCLIFVQELSLLDYRYASAG